MRKSLTELTESEYKERIFETYKSSLEATVGERKEIKFCNIVPFCKAPKINPYEMAAACMRDGFTIAYDNKAGMTEKVNDPKRKVEKILHRDPCFLNYTGPYDKVVDILQENEEYDAVVLAYYKPREWFRKRSTAEALRILRAAARKQGNEIILDDEISDCPI